MFNPGKKKRFLFRHSAEQPKAERGFTSDIPTREMRTTIPPILQSKEEKWKNRRFPAIAPKMCSLCAPFHERWHKLLVWATAGQLKTVEIYEIGEIWLKNKHIRYTCVYINMRWGISPMNGWIYIAWRMGGRLLQKYRTFDYNQRRTKSIALERQWRWLMGGREGWFNM